MNIVISSFLMSVKHASTMWSQSNVTAVTVKNVKKKGYWHWHIFWILRFFEGALQEASQILQLSGRLVHSGQWASNPIPAPKVGVFDTLSDWIQYLNFAKKWFIQYSIQYCFTQYSIQNIIQFKICWFNSKVQFISQGIIHTGRMGKVPKNYFKNVQNRLK